MAVTDEDEEIEEVSHCDQEVASEGNRVRKDGDERAQKHITTDSTIMDSTDIFLGKNHSAASITSTVVTLSARDTSIMDKNDAGHIVQVVSEPVGDMANVYKIIDSYIGYWI